MKKVPIDVSSFKVLRTENYIYVDKTKHIYNLVTGGRFYFLSRPRRFGKSLFISTLLELYSGNRELFEGLWIDRESDYDWKKHPVIHLDFSLLPIKGGNALEQSLNYKLDQIAKQNGIDVSQAPTPGLKLDTLVQYLATKNLVVVLVDEYDYPLVNNITNNAVAKENHAVLHDFYNALKGLDRYLKAIFVTGITKYAKTSLFSGLNNLNDLSLDQRAASLLGYSKEEIHHHFPEELKKLALKEQKSVDEIVEFMRIWYDGYRFSEQPVYVYNPFSILYCLQKQKFANYWFESGTPSFLIDLLKQHYQELEDIKETKLTSTSIGPFDIGELPLIPILFQTGYLSIADHCQIKEGDQIADLYTLKYPNSEVAQSFKKYLLAALTDNTYRNSDMAITELMTALHRNDIASFCTVLKSLVAHIPYQLHIPEEKYYHSLLQLLSSLLNYEPQAELATDQGRIDMVISTKDRVFIFEIKYNENVTNALKQIDARKYYERYHNSKKKIVLVGISFKRADKQLTIDYKIKELI